MELILTLALAMTAVPGPSGIELERLADNSYDPPGVVGEFIIENFPPVPCGESVLFNGYTFQDIRLGAYSASSAGVAVIANGATPVPGSDKTFAEALELACAGRQIAFLGDDDKRPLSAGRSVYLVTDGVISLLLKEGIAIGASVVQSFNRLDMNQHGVAMVAALQPASIAQGLVIKPFNGQPFIVADKTTVLPGQTDPATIFAEPVLVGSDLVFHARTQLNLGIYRWTQDRGMSVVADTATPVSLPGAGNFGIFDLSIASLDYGVVFAAGYFGGFGIFVARNGRVEPLVVPGQTTEDGETLTFADSPSGAGTLLSFRATTAENPPFAIFVRTHDGRLRRILGLGDTIEGQRVDFINAGADRTSVAIRINRRLSLQETTQEVIYRASFPEPNAIPTLSTWGIAVLLLGFTLTGLRLLRR